MKIVIVGPFPPPMNGCSYANEVLKRSLSLKQTCEAIDTATSHMSTIQGGSFSFRKAASFLRVYLQLTKILKSDVVYFTPGQTFFGVLKYAPFIVFCLVIGRPYVFHVHGNHLGAHYRGLGGAKRRLFRYLVGGADAGIVLSESLRQNFDGLLPSSRVFVVENFAGDEMLRHEISPKDATVLKVLYLSNLMHEKGILELLDGLLMLKKKGVAFQAQIAGQMEAGIEVEVVPRMEELGDCVQFIGSVSGAAKFAAFEWSNIFVLPTYYAMEGQPIALLEGLATGNIIVSTAHAGIPDVIGAANGYLVPVRSANAICDALVTIDQDIDGHVRKYSAHNRKYAGERFSEQRFADHVLRVLQIAVAGSRAEAAPDGAQP